MSSDAAKKDFNTLRKTISRGIRGTVFIATPASVGLILVARPLVSAVFERGEFTAADTKMTAWTLLFYALGLCGFFTQQIVTRAFYSMQDSKMPARSAIIAVFLNLILNLTLIWYLGTGGLALSTAICSYVQVVILIIILRKRFGHKLLHGLSTTIVKTALASAVMYLAGVVILHLMRNLPTGTSGDVARLVAVVPAAGLVYTIIAKILRAEMLSLVIGKKQ